MTTFDGTHEGCDACDQRGNRQKQRAPDRGVTGGFCGLDRLFFGLLKSLFSLRTQILGLGFRIGQRVYHEKFGYGQVLAADGTKLQVNFEKAGLKKVISTFVTGV